MAPLYFLCSSLLALSIFYPGCALRDADEDSARIGDDILIGDSIYQMVVDGQQISRSRPERGYGYCNDYYAHQFIIKDIKAANDDLGKLMKGQVVQLSDAVKPQDRELEELRSSVASLSDKTLSLCRYIDHLRRGLALVSQTVESLAGGVNVTHIESTYESMCGGATSSSNSANEGTTSSYISSTMSSAYTSSQSNFNGSFAYNSSQSNFNGSFASYLLNSTASPFNMFNVSFRSTHSTRRKRGTHAHIYEDLRELRENMALLFQEQLHKIADTIIIPQNGVIDEIKSSFTKLSDQYTSLFDVVGAASQHLSNISKILDITEVEMITPEVPTTQAAMVLPDMPPRILFQSTERTLYFEEGDVVQLECVAYGYPIPSYRWLKNGTPFSIEGSSGIIMVEGSGTLIFHGGEEGTFQCFADNRVGTSVSDKVTVVKAYLKEPTHTYVQTRRDRPGWSEQFYCPVVDSQPPAQKFWAIKDKNGTLSEVTESERVSKSKTNDNLCFSNVIPEDDGHYVCIAANPVTRSNSEYYANMLIIDSIEAELLAPFILNKSPSPMIGFEDEDVTLECIFGGNPTPQVSWSRKGYYGNLQQRASQFGWGKQLRISRMQKLDVDTYICSANNSETNAPVSVEIELKMGGKPRWSWAYGHRDQEITIGERGADRVRVVCNAYGIPKPVYTWYINGIEISESYIAATINYEIIKRDPGILILRNLTVNDQMTIQCNATNKYGYVFTNTAIYIRDPTSPDPFSSITPALCRDLLGSECQKVKNEGHCDNAKASLFCLATCDKCPTEATTAAMGA